MGRLFSFFFFKRRALKGWEGGRGRKSGHRQKGEPGLRETSEMTLLGCGQGWGRAHISDMRVHHCLPNGLKLHIVTSQLCILVGRSMVAQVMQSRGKLIDQNTRGTAIKGTMRRTPRLG